MSILTYEPFDVRFEQQLTLLRGLAGLYDGGTFDHARSMADRLLTMFEMLHSRDGGRLLKQHGGLFPTRIDPDSNEKRTTELAANQSFVNDDMVIVKSTSLPVFIAEPNAPTFWIPFGKWQNQVCFHLGPADGITRQQLIGTMRNKDGGAHPYSDVGDAYTRFAGNQGVLSISATGSDGKSMPLNPPPHFASVRQIAHEMDKGADRLIYQIRKI